MTINVRASVAGRGDDLTLCMTARQVGSRDMQTDEKIVHPRSFELRVTNQPLPKEESDRCS